MIESYIKIFDKEKPRMLKFISISSTTLFDVPNYIIEREKVTPAVGINFFIRKGGI